MGDVRIAKRLQIPRGLLRGRGGQLADERDIAPTTIDHAVGAPANTIVEC